MSETILKLEFPFPDGQGNTITELKIRRPKVRDIRKMTGKTETEMAVSLLAIVTGLVPEPWPTWPFGLDSSQASWKRWRLMKWSVGLFKRSGR